METLQDGNLVSTVEVQESVSDVIRLLAHYKKDVEYFTGKVAEYEAKLATAKSLGFVEPE